MRTSHGVDAEFFLPYTCSPVPNEWWRKCFSVKTTAAYVDGGQWRYILGRKETLASHTLWSSHYFSFLSCCCRLARIRKMRKNPPVDGDVLLLSFGCGSVSLPYIQELKQSINRESNKRERSPSRAGPAPCSTATTKTTTTITDACVKEQQTERERDRQKWADRRNERDGGGKQWPPKSNHRHPPHRHHPSP
jgi:hypothetical protein